MFEPVRVVEVRVWGQTVGAVALDPKLGYYAFEYDPKFAASGIELAPRSMPLSAAAEPFIFTDLPEVTYKRLPAMLADALPDDFGNSLIDAWLAAQGVPKASITSLDRLAYMGRRGLGALEFKPIRGPKDQSSTAIQISELVESARRAVQGNLDTDAEAALQQIIQVGTSAGGARAKAAIAWNPQTQEIRAGQFDVDSGFEHWLLKFDGMGKDGELGSSSNYGRIEFAYSRMASRAGIQMSDCHLLEENGRAHFMTRRFDRDSNRKQHLQTLCALAHLDYKQKATHDYNQYLQMIGELKLGQGALEEAFRRIALNVMARNCDDHTKNLSFLLPQEGPWKLAPAYDVSYAHNPRGEWTYQHLMSVNGKFKDITRKDLLVVADRFGIGTAVKHLKAVHEAVAAWPGFAEEAGLPDADRSRIQKDHLLL